MPTPATVPASLGTPTDLTDQERLIDALNRLAADAVALYLKTKNDHWHVSGDHFRDHHLLFDEQADAILETVDVLAERVRKIGGVSLRSVGHVRRLQRVEDDERDVVPAREMLRALLDENRAYTENVRSAHAMADEIHDAGTAGILENVIDETERRVWFLHETLQGA